jgi:hypothetical protein
MQMNKNYGGQAVMGSRRPLARRHDLADTDTRTPQLGHHAESNRRAVLQ